ncbi:uncharacterized protein Dere_GG27099 [Drosophila erecta]|uniref:Uncharacterized protein n=1 Tax=Drosophila erecta TaxID=7220 RepID=A0A0Q5VJS4_DROER|nr:uncharacterized protein Dere_GG27099 [Drosophila erecta]
MSIRVRLCNCQPVGLIDVTDCYYGFPISLSFPHFMNGDLGLQQNITGLSPDPRKHSSTFVIQPESGLPLSLSVKVQINMHFKDLSNFPIVSVFNHLTVPMLWFEIMMSKLPDNLDSRFNFYLNILPLVNPLGFWSGILLGISLLGYAITRAMLHMSSFARQTANITDVKYVRANLFQNFAGEAANHAYSPCDIKLLDDLPVVSHPAEKQTVQDSAFITKTTYALDMEPALLDTGESSDEGPDCDVVTTSRNSTSTLYRADEKNCRLGDDICIECFSESQASQTLFKREQLH